jgi:hypothetical protein
MRMMDSTSSKERLLAAIEHRVADRPPLCFEGVCHGSVVCIDLLFPDPFDRARYYLDLGVDHALHLSPPWVAPAEFAIRQWEERADDDPVPLLVKEYRTPRGTLRQAVRRTSDYPHDQVPLFSDHHVPASRTRDYLVTREADLGALETILRPLRRDEWADFRARAREARRFCGDHGLLLAGSYPGVGDPLIWMSGVETVLMAGLEDPAFLQAYVAVVAAWNRGILEMMIDAGVEVAVRRGWYESTDFWSPDLYRRFLFESLRQEVEIAHQAGVKVSYVMNSGAMPLLPMFGELRFDILANIDPLAPRTDLARMKAAIGDRICLCGGVNNTHVLETGSPAAVARAVQDAVGLLAPGSGFILAPGDSVGYVAGVDQTVVRRNVLAMIAAWKEIR